MFMLALMAGLTVDAHAENAWATREVELKRWPAAVMESAPVTATAAVDETLEIVLEDGDFVRVKMGTEFGWVPADALTMESPEASDEPADAPAAPSQ